MTISDREDKFGYCPYIRSIIYMRKKSHISLAGQIMDSMELDNVLQIAILCRKHLARLQTIFCDDTS